MDKEPIFKNKRWCRVTIEESYIEKIVQKIKIKNMIGGLDEIDDFAVKILHGVLNGKNIWMDKNGVLR